MTSTTTSSTVGSRVQAIAPVAALVAWTLFVWIGRVRNIIDDETLIGWSRNWRLGFATSFIALAVGVGGLAIRQLTVEAANPWLANLVAILAVYGIVVWLIRGADIVLGDHSVGFKVVHAVLAVVSIGLGALNLRWFLAAQRANP